MLQHFVIDTNEVKRMIDAPYAPRQREYHEIMWVKKGAAHFVIDGDKCSVEANAFFIFPKGRIHQFLPLAPIEGEVIRFTEDTVDDFPRLLFSKFNIISEVKVNKSNNRSLSLLFEAFQEELKHSTDSSPVIVNLLKVIIYKLHKIKQQQFPVDEGCTKDSDTFDKFQLLLDQHILEHKSTSFYAQQLNITPRKLNESIHILLNKTTSDIIAERLLTEAKRAIAYTNNSFSEIAYDLGFQDNSYFTKFFKKHTNTTPKEFRQNVSDVK